MQFDSSLARKTVRFAISDGNPILPIGIVFTICLIISESAGIEPTSIAPGAIALILLPYCAISSANDLVKPAIVALLAE